MAIRGYRWVVLAVIFLASFVAYMLRVNISIVGETMMRDLGMSEYQLGFLISAFWAGYTVFQFPGGMIGDKFGPRKTIAAIAMLWSLLTIVIALVPGTDTWPLVYTMGALIAARFVLGVVQAPLYPVTIGGTIERWFPATQWGLPNGLTSTGLTLGSAATAPVVVWLMASFGWRGAFLIIAPVGVIVALAYWWLVTDDPEDSPHVTKEELNYIQSDRPPAEAVIEKGAWKLVLRDKNILLLTLSYASMNYVFFLFVNWFFYYLVSVREFSESDAGIFTAAQFTLGAIGGLVGGLACDTLVKKLGIGRGPRNQVMISLLLVAIFLYVGATSNNMTLTIVMLCCGFGFTQLTESPFWVATMGVAGRHSQVATGVLNTGGNLPGAIGGVMVPVIAGWFGWDVAIISGSFFAIAAAVLWMFIRADEPMAEKLS